MTTHFFDTSRIYEIDIFERFNICRKLFGRSDRQRDVRDGFLFTTLLRAMTHEYFKDLGDDAQRRRLEFRIEDLSNLFWINQTAEQFEADLRKMAELKPEFVGQGLIRRRTSWKGEKMRWKLHEVEKLTRCKKYPEAFEILFEAGLHYLKPAAFGEEDSVLRQIEDASMDYALRVYDVNNNVIQID